MRITGAQKLARAKAVARQRKKTYGKILDALKGSTPNQFDNVILDLIKDALNYYPPLNPTRSVRKSTKRKPNPAR